MRCWSKDGESMVLYIKMYFIHYCGASRTSKSGNADSDGAKTSLLQVKNLATILAKIVSCLPRSGTIRPQLTIPRLGIKNS